MRTNHQIVVAIVIEISSTAHRTAQISIRHASDAKALTAGENCQVDIREGGGGAVAEDHVRSSTTTAAWAGAKLCANYNIGKPIAVYIPSTIYFVAEPTAIRFSKDFEPSATRDEDRQIDGIKHRGRAVSENDVCCARLEQILWAGSRCTYDYVICSISIHVSGTTHSITAPVTSSSAPYPEARAARGKEREVRVRPATGSAEEYYCSTSHSPRRRIKPVGADDEVINSVHIDVSRSAHRATPIVILYCTRYLDGCRWQRVGRVDGAYWTTGSAEYQIRSAGINFRSNIGKKCCYQHILKPVLVHVTHTGDAVTSIITGYSTPHIKPLCGLGPGS
jgi:hypothetical protein